MPETIITVRGLGKRYVLGQQRQTFPTLRDALVDAGRGFARRLRGRGAAPAADENEIWSLKDVSFSVTAGERVAIVGRNGAGKSTLLKILSRITLPTQGTARIVGAVSSLLEVGTGFHPDLTGRENIFLNGAILGMRRAEIARKFDEIVAFAEIERFLDTPVKQYSSGMWVRLAFSVAAHLDPQILIIDEVLAVGDAEFQRKCLGKMESISRDVGRTILFVSHNLAAVRALCNRGILLSEGRLIADGTANEIAECYLRAQQSSAPIELPTGEHFEVTAIEWGNVPLVTFQPARIEIAFRPRVPVVEVGARLLFEDQQGAPILGLVSRDFLEAKVHAGKGTQVRCIFSIRSLPLTPGPFRLRFWLSNHGDGFHWEVPLALQVQVEETAVYGSQRIVRAKHGSCAAEAEVAISTGEPPAGAH